MKPKISISLSADLLTRIERERSIASRSAFIERELRRALSFDGGAEASAEASGRADR